MYIFRRTHNTQPSETRLHSCEICNKNFASKQHYEKHREMHKKTRVDNAASSTQATNAAHQAKVGIVKSLYFGSLLIFERFLFQDLYEVKQETSTAPQSQPTQSQMQIQSQPQQQPQIMHVDLDGNTITITQASDSSMPQSLANFVQLGFPQFQNSSGPSNQIVCKLEKQILTFWFNLCSASLVLDLD